MHIYLIPGLGFDQRIFENLDLDDFPTSVLNWIEPLSKETIHSYAKRMADLMVEKDVILIGHSFGGIISQEISKLRKIKKVILISSIRSRKENPWHFKIISPIFLHKLISKKLINETISIWGSSYGYNTPESQTLFKKMLAGYSNHYLKWAIKELSKWKNEGANENQPVFQIHGSIDNTFPIKRIRQPDFIVEGGSHFMVYDQAEIIREVILKETS